MLTGKEWGWWCRKAVPHIGQGKELRRGTTWLESDGARLHLMAGRFDEWTLHTLTAEQAAKAQHERQEADEAIFDARRWRRLMPDDLGGLAEGRIEQLGSSKFGQQHAYAWYVSPIMSELEEEVGSAKMDEEKGEGLPKAKAGRWAHLVLPFSFWHHSIFKPFGLSDFSSLGPGVELYFGNVISLGLVFILMGLVDLGSLLANVYAFRADERTCQHEDKVG